MNVLVLNEQQNQLQTIEIDVIKSVTGQFEASEIVNMFKDFFFNKMILDVTALKGYEIPTTYKTIADGINPDKVIFYLPEGSDLCTSGFLSRLIENGIYNFTTNIEGVKYLVKKSNTLKDVESILKMAQGPKQNDFIQQQQQQPQPQQNYAQQPQYNVPPAQEVNNRTVFTPVAMGGQPMIIGFQNVTDHAGATSLIYMIKKELSETYKNGVYAIELDKTDFLSYGDKTMVSSSSNNIKALIAKLTAAQIILVDLNNSTQNDFCTTIIYLMEPSTIKLNSLMRKNKAILSVLKNKDVILNMSLLSTKEISEIEYESGIKIMYNIPPLNDRKRNEVIADFLKKIKLINGTQTSSGTGKIFGLFRK